MINLLPPKQKEELLAQEQFKIVLILGIVIISFLLSLALILFSIKTFMESDLQIEKIFIEQKEKELKNLKIEDLEEKIKEYNITLSKLNDFYQKQKSLTEVLEKISKTLPEKIYLTTFNFDYSNSQISLSGFSPSRELLLELKENLEKSGDFKDINFPPTTWIESNNINFTVTFKMK